MHMPRKVWGSSCAILNTSDVFYSESFSRTVRKCFRQQIGRGDWAKCGPGLGGSCGVVTDPIEQTKPSMFRGPQGITSH